MLVGSTEGIEPVMKLIEGDWIKTAKDDYTTSLISKFQS